TVRFLWPCQNLRFAPEIGAAMAPVTPSDRCCFVEVAVRTGYRPAELATQASYAFRHRRSALLLCLAARPPCRALDHHGVVVDLGTRSQRKAGGAGLCPALAGTVRRGCRTNLRLHAG